jgi:hypothetical protein
LIIQNGCTTTINSTWFFDCHDLITIFPYSVKTSEDTEVF